MATESIKDWNPHIDRILQVLHSIQPHRLTILTGPNASGKSLIRKQLTYHLMDSLGLPRDRPCVASIALSSRMSRSDGAPNFFYEDDSEATSVNTIRLLNAVLKTSDRFIVFDEPELGMSEETQLATALFLNGKKQEIIDRNLGILLITHSRVIASNIQEDDFLSVDPQYTSKEAWLTRTVVPTDLSTLPSESCELYRAILKRLQKLPG